MPCSTPKPVSRASLPSAPLASASRSARGIGVLRPQQARSRRFPEGLVRAARRTRETTTAGLDAGVAAGPLFAAIARTSQTTVTVIVLGVWAVTSDGAAQSDSPDSAT